MVSYLPGLHIILYVLCTFTGGPGSRLHCFMAGSASASGTFASFVTIPLMKGKKHLEQAGNQTAHISTKPPHDPYNAIMPNFITFHPYHEIRHVKKDLAHKFIVHDLFGGGHEVYSLNDVPEFSKSVWVIKKLKSTHIF